MAAKSSRFLAFWVLAGVLWTASVPSCACTGKAVDRDKSATRLELAKDFLNKGELEAADLEANRALGFNPNNEEAHNLLGLVAFLRAAGNQRLIEIDDCLTGVDAEALRKERDERLLEADRHFARALALVDDFGEAWSNRGSVALQLGDCKGATHYLEEALARPARLLSPPLSRAHLGWARFHCGDLVGAAKELRQAEQFQPGMCVAVYRLGRVYFARQEWEKAFDRFQRVVAQPADCPIQEAHLFLMKTYVELGMTESVPPAAKSCLALGPKSCVAAECRAVAP